MSLDKGICAVPAGRKQKTAASLPSAPIIKHTAVNVYPFSCIHKATAFRIRARFCMPKAYNSFRRRKKKLCGIQKNVPAYLFPLDIRRILYYNTLRLPEGAVPVRSAYAAARTGSYLYNHIQSSSEDRVSQYTVRRSVSGRIRCRVRPVIATDNRALFGFCASLSNQIKAKGIESIWNPPCCFQRRRR